MTLCQHEPDKVIVNPGFEKDSEFRIQVNLTIILKAVQMLSTLVESLSWTGDLRKLSKLCSRWTMIRRTIENVAEQPKKRSWDIISKFELAKDGPT